MVERDEDFRPVDTFEGITSGVDEHEHIDDKTGDNNDSDEGNDKPKEGDDKPKEGEEEGKETPDKEDEEESASEDDSKDDDSSETDEDDSEDDDEGYYLDDEGNLAKDGEVVVKKENLEKDEEGNYIIPEESEVAKIASSLSDEFGITYEDDEGNPLEYDDTHEGLTRLAIDTVNRIVDKRETQVFQEYPDVQKYLNHLVAGGKPEEYHKFIQETSDQEFTLPGDEETDDTHNEMRKSVIMEEYLINSGYYDTDDKDKKASIRARANKHIDRIVDSGDEELIEESKLAHKNIKDHREAVRLQKEERDREAIKEKEKAEAKFVDNLLSTVDNRKLKTITIPKKEVSGFKDYLTKPVKDGYTQEMLDVNNEPLEDSLELAYMRYMRSKGLSLDHLVDIKMKSENAKKVKIRKQKKVKVGSGEGRKKDRSNTIPFSQITIENIG